MNLLKHVYAKNDYEGEPYFLHYLKTKEGKEVDFAITDDDHVLQAIEVKVSQKKLNQSLVWFYN